MNVGKIYTLSFFSELFITLQQKTRNSYQAQNDVSDVAVNHAWKDNSVLSLQQLCPQCHKKLMNFQDSFLLLGYSIK